MLIPRGLTYTVTSTSAYFIGVISLTKTKNPKVILLPLLAFVAVVITSAVIQNIQNPPPKTDDCGEDHSQTQEQPQVLSGKLQDIDLAKAKVVVIQPKELADQKCADEIAKSLNALNAVGNLTVDLAKKLVTVQYDSAKVTESRILEAFFTAQHEAMILRNYDENGAAKAN
jgi:copper chaperone CopZ